MNVPALLEKSNSVFEDIDRRGFRIDIEKLDQIVSSYETEIKTLLSGRTAKDLKTKAEQIAASTAGWPTTDSGKLSLSDNAISKMHPLDSVFSEYLRVMSLRRQVSTMTSYRSMLDADGRIHPEHRVRPDLGRVYVANFNYTNLPKECRAIVLPEPGCIFYSLDGKSTEMVVLAWASGDELLKQALAGPDFHKATASRLFGVSVDSVSDEQRKQAKVVSYAIIFGATEFFLSTELGISVEEAEIFLSRFSIAYPKAAKFISEAFSKGDREGISTTVFGTTRRFPAPGSGKSAVSHAIQSSAGELFRCALPFVSRFSSENGGALNGTLFDSYLISLPAGSELLVEDLKTRVEAGFNRIGYPVKLEIETCGEHWR